MHFKLPLIAAMLATVGLGTATPLFYERQATTTPPAQFHLQTKVVGSNTDYGSNKDGLYVYSFHTGAGLGDACLSSNQSWAAQASYNGTDVLFYYPSLEYPWPFAVGYGAYQSWYTTTISVAEQPGFDPGYFFNETGLQYNYTNGGWLACDWWHGVPQLFSVADYQYGPLPASCSQVELYPIAV